MARYLGPCWKCRCGHIDSEKPWNCPNCDKEVCDRCFARYALCEVCSALCAGDEEAMEMSERGGWDWSELKEERNNGT